MDLANGDYLRLRITQTHLGQTLYNVLHFIVTSVQPPFTVSTGLTAYCNDYLALARAMQSTALNYTEFRWDNLTDELGFLVIPANTPGLIEGQDMPSYVAGNFTKKVGTKLTRPGSLRLGGVTEGQVSQNTWSPDSTDVADFEDFLADTWVYEPSPNYGFTLNLIVLRMIQKDPSIIYVDNPVTSVVHSPIISTQVSRKAGRGE